MDKKLRTNKVRARSFTWFQMVEGCNKFSWRKISGDISCIWSSSPPRVRQFLRNKSINLSIFTLVFHVFYQLASNSICWRGTLRRELLWSTVRLFNVLHAIRLEGKKSMFWTASDHRSLRFLSSLASKAVTPLLDSCRSGCCKNVW